MTNLAVIVRNKIPKVVMLHIFWPSGMALTRLDCCNSAEVLCTERYVVFRTS
jgi:hypothetical protein